MARRCTICPNPAPDPKERDSLPICSSCVKSVWKFKRMLRESKLDFYREIERNLIQSRRLYAARHGLRAVKLLPPE